MLLIPKYKKKKQIRACLGSFNRVYDSSDIFKKRRFEAIRAAQNQIQAIEKILTAVPKKEFASSCSKYRLFSVFLKAPRP